MNFTNTVILSSFWEPVVLSECKKKGGLRVVDESAGGRSAAETGSRITQLSRSSGHSVPCRAAESDQENTLCLSLSQYCKHKDIVFRCRRK